MEIHPDLIVHPSGATYKAASRDLFFPDGCHDDYIVDAIDLVTCKLDLIEAALRVDIPIISALGTGNKWNPELLCITDIAKTFGCPLARVMRKELRHRGIDHLPVVFSPEEPLTPLSAETPAPGRRSVPASNPWVPATAGRLLGSAVVRARIEKEEKTTC